MTQKEKDLLLKDLCARLLYGVKLLDISYKKYGPLDLLNVGSDGSLLVDAKNEDIQYYPIIENVKPYLRKMSSMTEEEEEEYNNLVDLLGENEPYFVLEQMMVDFYHKHHFDNRFLIPKGLALEAPDGMYN